MERRATGDKRMAKLGRRFERFRLSEEVLASAYERLVPLGERMPASLSGDSQTRSVARQPRPARRMCA